MPSKRIDELTTRTVVNTDLLPPTPSGGPSGSATVAAVVKAGLQQPNSASAGSGADITIKSADGVTSGAGGSIVLEPGLQATTGGNGRVKVKSSNYNEYLEFYSLNHEHYINGKAEPVSPAAQYLFCTGFYQIQLSCYALILPNYVSFNQESAYYNNALMMRKTASIYWSGIGEWHQGGNDIGFNRASVGILRVSDASTGGGSLAYTSSTPSAITTSQNNYVLTGSAFQRLNCTTASDLTGIAPPSGGAHVDGRMIRLISVGTDTVTLKHNDASSTAANRIYSSTGSDIALATNAWADLIYDSTDNGSGAAGWRAK